MNMKNVRYFMIGLIFIACIVRNADLYSQNIQWTARLNGNADSIDVAKAIAIDNQGNVYVTGYSTELLLLTDIVTVKYSPSGATLWTSSYGGLLYDEGDAITLDDTQFVYVAGFTNRLLNLLGDYVVIKYNAATGDTVWVRTYDGSAHGLDYATSLALDSQHNIYVTGSATMNGLVLGNIDYVTLKYDINGNLLWTADYDGPARSEDDAYKVKVDGLNNVIVTGYSKNGLLGTGDYATVKYNQNGAQLWAERYDGPGHGDDIAHDVAIDNANNVFVTGESQGSSSGLDYATIKYNSSGVQQWVARYNGPGNGEDRAYAIVVDNTDSPVITGESVGTGSLHDYATVKYDQNGNQQWASRYNGPGNGEDRAYAIVVDNTDNVFVTGESGGNNSGQDYATVKYNNSGSQQWAVIYNGPGNSTDRAYAIVVDNTDNVYVTGTSQHSSLLSSEDYLTIKYADPLAVTPVSNETPAKFNLYQNYPNPFNPVTTIKVDIARESDVSIELYDILGNKIRGLIKKNLHPGSYEISLDAENLPSGIYIYRMTSDAYTESKKMILLK